MGNVRTIRPSAFFATDVKKIKSEEKKYTRVCSDRVVHGIRLSRHSASESAKNILKNASECAIVDVKYFVQFRGEENSILSNKSGF